MDGPHEHAADCIEYFKQGLEGAIKLTESDKQRLSQKIYEIKEAKIQKQIAEQKEIERKEELLSIFESLGITSYTAHDTDVRYTKPTTYQKINSSKLKKELPDVFAAYSAPESRKGFLTIKIRDDEDSDEKFIEKYFTDD